MELETKMNTNIIKKLNLQDREITRNILALQKDSYKIEAEIIGFYDIPPLKDTVDSLIECNEIFYGYHIDDVLAGIISYKIIENVLDIHRVSVHPNFFRKRIGESLLHFVEKIDNCVNKVVVCTGKDNLPAVNLYLKNGYIRVKDIEISKDVYLTEFKKIL